MKAFLIPVSIVGVLLGIVFLFFFIFNRIYRIVLKIRREEAPKLGFFRSIRNFIFILLWNFFFGMMLFAGFFIHAFHAFSWEKPVADVLVEPTKKPKISRVNLIVFSNSDTIKKDVFLVHGDYWMIEGDIVKWTYYGNFLGLNTRYRLSRLRGRFESIEEEKKTEPTIYSLSNLEGNLIWKTMYKLYKLLPFVRAVYGNAVYQSNQMYQKYRIYVTQSGFIAVPVDSY